MLHHGVNSNENGTVLIIILIFLLVFTILLASNGEDVIVNLKMHQALKQHFLLLLRAESGMRQVVLSIEGHSVELPDSPVLLKTHIDHLKVDDCGNQTVKIVSQASEGDDTVILNSEDIFARVPTEKGCSQIPLHRCLWWAELREGY